VNPHAWFAFAVGLVYGIVIGGILTLGLVGW
jgi:uncharacterized membrane-anchored protein YhcB (DUF1043 family)